LIFKTLKNQTVYRIRISDLKELPELRNQEIKRYLRKKNQKRIERKKG